MSDHNEYTDNQMDDNRMNDRYGMDRDSYRTYSESDEARYSSSSFSNSGSESSDHSESYESSTNRYGSSSSMNSGSDSSDYRGSYESSFNSYGSSYTDSSSQQSASCDSNLHADNGNSYQYGSTYGSYSESERSNAFSSDSGSTSGGGSGASGKNHYNKKKHDDKTPRKGGLFRRAAAIAMAAVLFGGIAGSTMVGVQYAAEKAGMVSGNTVTGNVSDALVADETNPIKTSESLVSNNNSGTSGGNSIMVGDVSGIVEQMLPAVVSITNSQIYESYANQYGNFGWPYFFGGSDFFGNGGGRGNGGNGSSRDDGNEEQQEVEAGSGSGILIGQNEEELLIVTNYHVIENADSLTITFIDDSTAKAAVKGTDSENDLAVVSVKKSDLSAETQKAITIATMDTNDDCKVGQGVVAIGNALGYGQSVTVGYISALNRAVQSSDGSSRNLLQTDAAINPGNSGGALINLRGEVIGINSAKYSSTDVEGMGFAIPVSAVKDIINDLMNKKTKIEVEAEKRGYLGIKGVTVDAASAKTYDMPEGVYVHTVMDGGAASKSDLKAKDIITKMDGEKISSMEDITEELKYHSIGDTVVLTVYRLNGSEYESVDVSVTLAAQVTE